MKFKCGQIAKSKGRTRAYFTPKFAYFASFARTNQHNRRMPSLTPPLRFTDSFTGGDMTSLAQLLLSWGSIRRESIGAEATEIGRIRNCRNHTLALIEGRNPTGKRTNPNVAGYK